MHFAKLQNVIYNQTISGRLPARLTLHLSPKTMTIPTAKGQSSPCISISINLARGVCACVCVVVVCYAAEIRVPKLMRLCRT